MTSLFDDDDDSSHAVYFGRLALTLPHRLSSCLSVIIFSASMTIPENTREGIK